ncbi:hypothetical protein [Hymenobacter canadensis]|uniref:Uncharacterized protein n=1 Tax=Hymenobacter canadensis TaxID=2999067 RepID=A0ABY7LQW0_9BACT|nr:hypothetical protein [Hymenobacter canadensis]WBA42801.1 hypothetical protein O3303_04385 [Hymenobacter canadensis]
MNYGRHKKIRGGKRHLKRLVRLSQTAASLSEQRLQQSGYNYKWLGLGVWHWHHRQPPKRVRQLAARHLLTTFRAWQRQLQAQPEPFYLAIWLVCSPEFAHSSKVVAAIQGMRARYRDRLQEADPAGPPLPPEYRQLPGANQLTWHAHPWEILVDSFDYPDGWPAWALAKPHYLCQPEDNDEYLMVQTGWVWVGQAAADSPLAT